MAELLISAAAEKDFSESLQWYAERSLQAADGFELAVAEGLRAISDAPDSFPRIDNRHHFYRLRRYPFQLIYRGIAADRWLVVAMAHTSRRPGYWRDR